MLLFVGVAFVVMAVEVSIRSSAYVVEFLWDAG